MKVTDYISQKLLKVEEGEVFTYKRFLRDAGEKEAVIKALNRRVDAGKLSKLSRGRYYKPEESAFGELEPSQEEVVKDLLGDPKKPVGYLTGLSIYNRLGLTTQVSNTIQIGKNDIRPAFKRGRFKISFIRQKNKVTRYNIPLLQILDCIRYIKKIPDTPTAEVVLRIRSILDKLGEDQIKKILDLAAKYPPATRALLGALLEANGIPEEQLSGIRRSLNPITAYRIQGVAETLPNASRWNIK